MINNFFLKNETKVLDSSNQRFACKVSEFLRKIFSPCIYNGLKVILRDYFEADLINSGEPLCYPETKSRWQFASCQ